MISDSEPEEEQNEDEVIVVDSGDICSAPNHSFSSDHSTSDEFR